VYLDTKVNGIINAIFDTDRSSHTPIIGGFIWNDLNMDGIQDLGEPGIDNIRVWVVNEEWTRIVSETKTNASGNYLVSDNIEGSNRYWVVIHLGGDLFGYRASPHDEGDDERDSDGIFNENVLNSMVLVMTEWTEKTNVDFGIFLPTPVPTTQPPTTSSPTTFPPSFTTSSPTPQPMATTPTTTTPMT